jgi:large-conductance mechanosensitive channel
MAIKRQHKLVKKAKPAASAHRTAREERVAEHERQKKEVAAKLRNLSATAKAEIVDDILKNEVINKQVGGFTNFLREQSVIGIGIGLVFGTQTKTVVDSIMKSFVDPVTKLILPGQQALTEKSFTLHFHGREANIVWGNIVYNVFSFIMVAIVVYLIYRLLRLDKLAKKKDEDPKPEEKPEPKKGKKARSKAA